MGTAGHTRAVLDLFDIDVVGCDLHTLDVVVVVDDVHYYLVGLDIDDVDVAAASHADASTFAHQYYFHRPAEMSSNWEDSVDD